MTEISDVVEITVNVADTRISQAGFGVPAIFAPVESTVFTNRSKRYNDLEELSVDFSTVTKVYACAAAIWSQSPTVPYIKVIRREAGDASHTAALNAIVAEDSEWYCLLTTYRLPADLQEIGSWILTQGKVFFASTEEADILNPALATDTASVLKAATNHRSSIMWHHEAGKDSASATSVIASEVVTVSEATHGLLVGDTVVVSGQTETDANGSFSIATVPTDGTFTYSAPGAGDDAGPTSITYFARYTFPEAAWAGRQLTFDPGESTWKFKQLAGIIPSPKTILSGAGESAALAKYANLYTPLAGVGHTLEGTMASGRFIDVQRGIDWLEARIGEAVVARLLNDPKIPYTDAGGTVLYTVIAEVMDSARRMKLLGPILTSDSGEYYIITIPKVADQATADRQNRYFPGIVVQAQLAGAIHRLAITINAQV